MAYLSPTLDTTISVDSTESQTKTETRNWEVYDVHKVAPHSKIDVKWAVNRKQCTGTFHSDVILSGHIAIKSCDKIVDNNNKYKSGKHKLWFIPIDRVFKEMKEWGIEFPSQYLICDGHVTYRVSGLFEGESGSYTSGAVKQTSLPTGTE